MRMEVIGLLFASAVGSVHVEEDADIEEVPFVVVVHIGFEILDRECSEECRDIEEVDVSVVVDIYTAK